MRGIVPFSDIVPIWLTLAHVYLDNAGVLKWITDEIIVIYEYLVS